MSKTITTPSLVIEWSSRGVRTYDAMTGATGTTLDGLQGRDAVLAFGRRSAFIKVAYLPPAADDELRQIVAVRASEFLPLPVDQIAYSVVQSDRIADGGRVSQVAAVSLVEYRSALNQLSASGIRVKVVTVAALGSIALAEHAGLNSGAVVQQTIDGIAIDVVEEGTLRYARVVGAGADLEGEICRTFTVAGQPCGPVLAAGSLPFAEADKASVAHSLQYLANAPLPSLTLELPEEREKRRKTAKQKEMRQSVLLATATLALAAYAYSEWDDRQLAVSKVETRYKNRLKQLEGAKKIVESDVQKLATSETTLKRAFQPAQRFTDMIAVATSEMPKEAWLTGISVDRGREMQLRGTAKNGESVAEYVRRLTKQSRFRNVRLVFANNAEIDKQPVVQFSIALFPVGNLSLTSTQKGVAKK